MDLGLNNLLKKSIPIGVDISNESIVIVELNKLKNTLELNKVGIGITPPNSIRDGEIINPDKIAATIQEIMTAHNIKAKTAITAVSGQSTIIRSPLRFPSASLKELKEVILHDAERYIPFAIDDVNIDFQILGQVQEGNVNQTEVILVAAQKQLIQSYIDTFTLAGLNLLCVDVAAFSVLRALSGDDKLNDNKVVGLILIRGETTDITVLKGGVPKFYRSIPIGDTTFIETLASNLNLELEDAIQLYDRLEVPISSELQSKDKLIEQGKEELKSSLKELSREVFTSLEYFHQSQDTDKIEQIILAGRGAKLKNIDQFFYSSLGVEISIANPIPFLTFDESQYPTEFLYQNAPVLATAIGLAKRGVEEF